MPKILRSQLPVVFASKVDALDKDKKPIKNPDGSVRQYTNFYVLLASGKYVRIKPAYMGTPDKRDNRDLVRLLDNVPLIQSLQDIE